MNLSDARAGPIARAASGESAEAAGVRHDEHGPERARPRESSCAISRRRSGPIARRSHRYGTTSAFSRRLLLENLNARGLSVSPKKRSERPRRARPIGFNRPGRFAAGQFRRGASIAERARIDHPSAAPTLLAELYDRLAIRTAFAVFGRETGPRWRQSPRRRGSYRAQVAAAARHDSGAVEGLDPIDHGSRAADLIAGFSASGTTSRHLTDESGRPLSSARRGPWSAQARPGLPVCDLAAMTQNEVEGRWRPTGGLISEDWRSCRRRRQGATVVDNIRCTWRTAPIHGFSGRAIPRRAPSLRRRAQLLHGELQPEPRDAQLHRARGGGAHLRHCVRRLDESRDFVAAPGSPRPLRTDGRGS